MVTVQTHERIVHHRHGVLQGVLAPGRHRLWGLGHRLESVDVRLRHLGVALQEVSTADGIRVKAAALVRWRIVDPLLWVEGALDPEDVLYDAVRLSVRDVVGTLSVEEVTQALTAGPVPDQVVSTAESIGVEVVEHRLSDVVLPAEVRRAAESLVVARHRAQAELEKARGQSAAIRNLTNVAGVLEDHPALAAMRLAETVAEAGGSVVLERPAR